MYIILCISRRWGDAHCTVLIIIFFWTWKANILLKCTISNILRGARMKACYRAETSPKSNYAIMESRCRDICNLMCAKVNMFVRLPLNRVTVLHKWFLVLYNEDSFSWLLLLAVTLPRSTFSLVLSYCDWMTVEQKQAHNLTYNYSWTVSGRTQEVVFVPCFCYVDMKTNTTRFVNSVKIMPFSFKNDCVKVSKEMCLIAKYNQCIVVKLLTKHQLCHWTRHYKYVTVLYVHICREKLW